MACIGFDLDETLGRFGAAFYNIVALTPQQSLYNESWGGKYGVQRVLPPSVYSDSLDQKLKHAFQLFCECIAEKERTGLGLIRPEMIQIARRLYELKQENPPRVKAVVIYSNNGNMATLYLAARVIEILANASGLFCNFLNWFHPLRSNEIQHGKPGSGQKKLSTLLKAFEEGGCPKDEIDIEHVYFFDDLVHPDIAAAIGQNYFHIPPYKVDANPKYIDECFLKAFKEADLENDKEYWAYIAPLQVKNLDELMRFFQANKLKFLRKEIPNNTALQKKFQKIFPHHISKETFIKSLLTLRKLENKQNKGTLLTTNERRLLNNSKSIIDLYNSQNTNKTGGNLSLKTRRRKRKSKN